MIKAPEQPWTHGEAEYNLARLVVNVVFTQEGGLFSSHQFLTDRDEAEARAMPSAGNEQIAAAFLREAIMREIFVVITTKIKNDPTFLARYIEASESDKSDMVRTLASQSGEVMRRTLERLLMQSTRGMVDAMVNGYTIKDPS